ncbi:C39 family peptidase [Myxococcus qinghaiensis]|uniref:C39 family peptidase n=1 Tax=Myxococcus qinghaiensis TaxID=2906758 RepID=UPI0020A7E730|nr:C39 family peptidase [Myxococcus qinghaiensis]MCP3163692.1 C39 family peptidase [Myxococcus qinghaiensis]
MDSFDARGPAPRKTEDLKHLARTVGPELREAAERARRDEKLEDMGAAVRARLLLGAAGSGKLDDLKSSLQQHALREALSDAGGEKLKALETALQRHALRESLGDAAAGGKLEELKTALQQRELQAVGTRVAEALRNNLESSAPEAQTTDWQVQPGDTVGDISWSLMQQGVPGPVEDIARQIVELNGLENPDLIHAGSTLQVPAPPTSPEGVPAPGVPPQDSAPTPGSTPQSPATPGERYPVPYINQINSEGAEDDWNRFSNCGPTTMAMILKGFGLGAGMSDGAFINQLANSIGMGAEGTGYVGIEQMAANQGLTSETRAGSDTAWIQQQLEAGNLVAVNGESSVMLANEQPPNASGNFSGGHWIAVTGMTPEGNFIVHDPSSTCRVLTPDQLSRFLAEHHAGGFATAIRPPQG